MSLPHHHVFNAIQPQIQEGVPIQKILPLLLDSSIIKRKQADQARRGGRINGMKIICGYIKNQSFETFLKFVKCMCELMSTDPECNKTVPPVLESIVEVVKDFDENYHTEHAKSIIDIIKPYQTPVGEETTEREEEEQKALAESKSLTDTGPMIEPYQREKATEGEEEELQTLTVAYHEKLSVLESDTKAAVTAISQPPIGEEATEREEEQETLALNEEYKSLTVERDTESILKPYQTPVGEKATEEAKEELQTLVVTYHEKLKSVLESDAKAILRPPIGEEATEREEEEQETLEVETEEFKSLAVEGDAEAPAAAKSQPPTEEEVTEKEEEEQETLVVTEEFKRLAVEGDSEAAATALSQPIIKPYEIPFEEEATEKKEEQETIVVTEKFEILAARSDATAISHSSALDVLPDLPYVTKPKQATFNCCGGRYYNSDWEFAIDVPAGAVPEDQEVTIKIGACAYGPFDIPENYHIASGFICLVANKPFLEEVYLTLEHCLVRSDDQDDSNVVVLRSDHSVVSEGKFSFSPLPNTPDILYISYGTKTLSFQLKELCILCAAKKSDQSQSSQDHHDSMMDTSSGQADNKLRVNLGKKRSRSTESLGPDKSRRRLIEYAVLFFEPPLCKKTRPFNVLAFVCHNCTISMKECQKQAERKLELQDAQLHKLEFNFGHTKDIKFSLERKRTPEWSVSLKGQEWVSEDSINKYTMPLNQHDRDCLQIDLQEGYYPPFRVFEVCWSSSNPPKKNLKIEARVHNIEQTYCSKDYLSYKITANAGGAYCKNCQSQVIRTPDVECVRRLMERVENELSDSQKNLEAKEYHFAVGASFVQNFRYLCRVLQLSDTDVEQIEYDNPPDHDQATELPYQALCLWKQMRSTTTVNNLATVLASAGEVDAFNHLFKVLS